MKDYISFVESVFNEWKINGICKDAIAINEYINNTTFDTGNPHFFTGDLQSKIVMVQLNPKREIKEFKQETNKTFDEYLNYYTNYGKLVYGKTSSRKFKSRFDQKLIRFLKPLEIIDLNSNDIFKNLENVVDQKLQLELIPFGSPNFDYTKLPKNIIDIYTRQLLNAIFSEQRTCVIFGGRVFSHILKPFIITEKKYIFKLQKKNGEWTKNEYEIILTELAFNGKTLKAHIAPQFAQQGMPIDAYGKKLASILKN